MRWKKATSCFTALAFSLGQIAGASTPQSLADSMIATADALDKLAEAAPRIDYDVTERARTIGADPASLTSWVAANTVHDTYRGSLKGAQGTLEDRRGNSLDRALLLASMIKASGGEVRLARTTLPTDVVTKLAASLSTQQHIASPLIGNDISGPILSELAADPRVNGAALKSGSADSDTAVTDALKARAVAMSTRLQADVAPALASAPPADLTLALADHWWVQVRSGGTWVDYDPDAAAIGPQTATSTLSPDSVPNDATHSTTVRFIAETVGADGKLSSKTVLEKTLTTPQVNGRIVFLSFQPVDATDMGAVDLESEQAINGMAAGAVWLPMLLTDEETKQSLILADGSLEEATEANIQRYKNATAGSLAGSASGIDAIGPDADSTDSAGSKQSGFTAAWIEFEVVTPGEKTVTQRRVVFDVIGDDEREDGIFTGVLDDAALRTRGLAMRSVSSMVLQGGAVSPARMLSRLAPHMALARRATAAWVLGGAPDSPPSYDERFLPSNLPLNLWALERPFAGAMTSTNIALQRASFEVSDGQLVATEGFDIIANPTAAPNAADRISAGVADTLQEHMLLGEPTGMHNTAAAYEADIKAGKVWKLIKPSEGAAFYAPEMPTNVASLIKNDLAQGYAVLLPADRLTADVVWWRVDPATGQTLGMSPYGGSTILEKVIITGSVALVIWATMVRICRSNGGKKPGQSLAGCFADAISTKLSKWANEKVGGLGKIGSEELWK